MKTESPLVQALQKRRESSPASESVRLLEMILSSVQDLKDLLAPQEGETEKPKMVVTQESHTP